MDGTFEGSRLLLLLSPPPPPGRDSARIRRFNKARFSASFSCVVGRKNSGGEGEDEGERSDGIGRTEHEAGGQARMVAHECERSTVATN